MASNIESLAVRNGSGRGRETCLLLPSITYPYKPDIEPDKRVVNQHYSITSHYSSRFCGYHRIFCSLQDLESSGLVGSAALLVDLSVEMHFFIWARLPSVQVSPHHRRSTSREAFGTPPEHSGFHYIGLTPQFHNSTATRYIRSQKP